MKVLFLTNIPAPYRLKFFSLLGEFCDLTVIYELEYSTMRNNKWNEQVKKTFKEIYLNAKRVEASSGFSFDIIKYLKKDYDFIIVGTHMTPIARIAMLYMRLMNIPYIFNLDGAMCYPLNKMGKIGWFLRKFLLYDGAKYYITTTNEAINYLTYFNIDKNKILKYKFSSIMEKDVIDNIIEKEEKICIRKKLGIIENKVLISVGQFIPRKGFDVILKAKKYLPDDVGVYLIGGEITEEYRALIEQYGLKNIHFISFKTKLELEEFYKAADIFILPTRHDEWALVVNEAIAKGLPVITTNRCGAGLEIIKDYKNGFLINVDDVKDLANKVEIILDDEYLCKKINKNNLKLAKKYTIENMVKEHLEIFNKILEKHRRT
ncbi:glycosyltransferase family 4 protein [Megamonas hypermegale]|uniref:glycosyltransferase family 4 protein n=1 Tax=Megamonas hypermegale TaxID=158847 RepID=UPI00242E8EBB|nr:glycosyltransferase family 4 protein [Megamonas hypermegale]